MRAKEKNWILTPDFWILEMGSSVTLARWISRFDWPDFFLKVAPS